MKKFSKILSVALLVALVLSLGVANAFADGETPVATPVPTAQVFDNSNAADANGKYTISVATGDTHSYAVYQVLTGTLVAGENSLGNPQWGANATAAAKEGSVNDFITGVTGQSGNVAVNEYVAQFVDQTSTPIGTATTSNPVSVDPGYYLIVDTTPAADLDPGEGYSLNIVAVFNDITITPKKGTTTSDKKVDDINDSTGVEQKKNDSADHDIGDTISYTLTATLPADYANYKDYKLVFEDDMSAGLTLNAGSVKIHYGENDEDGTPIEFAAGGTSSYPSIEKGATTYTGHVYTYTITDLKKVAAAGNLGAGDVITITYTATLNEAAVIGSAGNPNIYRIEYSNNPNGEGEGHTPWDKNIVFTYKTVFNKVDGDQKPLTGADFALYKFVAATNGTETYKNTKGNWVDVTKLHGDNATNPTKTKETLTNANGTADNAKFSFAGLDDGYYKLVETETPDGYNTIDDIYFEITADHELVSENPALNDLNGAEGQTFVMTKTVSAGELSKDIQNNKGAVLPSTGGIGTTIFYVVGGVLVLAAIILLVTKKRMSD